MASHEESVRVSTGDPLRVTEAQVADIGLAVRRTNLNHAAAEQARQYA
jgi:hypothetical protein